MLNNNWILSPDRIFSDSEQSLIWIKPSSHIESVEEIRISNEVKRNWNNEEMKITNILLEGDAGSGKTQIAKALSSNFNLPYTKVTCFSDMDKSDIIGSILPVISDNEIPHNNEDDIITLKTLYSCNNIKDASEKLSKVLNLSLVDAEYKINNIVTYLKNNNFKDNVEYKFYESEIVRAFRNGYILEIQEPTVIRDAAVLMALNSALEHNGCINLPTEIVHKHPDFIAIITTNRGYNGCHPLNEALRDRVHHTEKMDLPSIETMIDRAKIKTGYKKDETLTALANVIVILDQTSKANAIKGVAGMRSYFYWIDAILNGQNIIDSMYNKVIYKITTDDEEIKILEHALQSQKIFETLNYLEDEKKN